MSIEIVVPELGESVVEATVGQWHKQEGDRVEAGELLVELQTDKVDLEVNAEATGVLTQIVRHTDEDVAIGDVLAHLDPAGDVSSTPTTQPEQPAQPAQPPQAAQAATEPAQDSGQPAATPVARRMAAAEGVDLERVAGTGAGGRVTKEDVQASLTRPATSAQAADPQPSTSPSLDPLLAATPTSFGRNETRTRLSRRRRTIAKRLVEAQRNAAMLTTFNEVDMSAVIAMRKKRQDAFVEREGVKLGFTSFFTKAVVAALKAFPHLNAEIDGDDMIVKHYYDIGIAVGAEQGLVVPVVRDADRLSFAEIERQVKAFAGKAREGTLSLADLMGGTFTITNGGVFGSMLSTPILNPPQVGILGLHNIVERPVVVDGEIVIRPIMYVALSYDHRIVDGREAVQFLYRIKDLIEDPEALLLAG